MSTGNINNYNNYGNMVFGNVSDSTLSVDNSIHQIERDIEEHGGADKEVLKELLDDVKELRQHRINAKNRIMQWVPNKNCG